MLRPCQGSRDFGPCRIVPQVGPEEQPWFDRTPVFPTYPTVPVTGFRRLPRFLVSGFLLLGLWDTGSEDGYGSCGGGG